jgi:hypothetical protein
MKRIILLCDGTWNEDDDTRPVTNIVRLRDLLARSLDARSSLLTERPPQGSDAQPAKRVAGRTRNRIEHIVYYDRGVGTGLLHDRILGGALGIGLERNVRQAYRFLAAKYDPGDEIYIFGFSRGSYTARSLLGYLGAVGLLRDKDCTPEREQEAWSYYRTPPNSRLSGIWCALTPFVHERARFRVKCLGVFDTVGALGIPHRWAWRLNRQRYEFHDVTLGSITDVNLHALAVDERREPFQATVWRKPQFKDYGSTVVEQVWFSGVHSDVGGGYVDHFEAHPDERRALDDITLDWMVRRVRKHTPLPLDLSRWKKIDRTWAECRHNESYAGFFRKVWRYPAVRTIANFKPALGSEAKSVGYDRLADAVGEMIHISVLERLGEQQRGPNTAQGYAPPNVIAVLERIEATYGMRLPTKMHSDLFLVDWAGEPIDAARGIAQQADLRALFDGARTRLGLAPLPVAGSAGLRPDAEQRAIRQARRSWAQHLADEELVGD